MGAAKKVKVRTDEKIRVLIADNDGMTSRRTMNFLNQHGFECRTSPNGNDAKRVLAVWRPRVLIVDLLLPDANAFEILRFCQQEPALRNQNISVLVMSGHNSEENVREAYQRGARDYIARPFMFQDLLNRVVFHCRDTREIDMNKKEVQDSTLKLADLVVSQALQRLPMEEMLYQLTQMAALKVKGLRCSVVHAVTHEKGVVLASSDKKDIAGFNLDLKKYPEILLAANKSKTVVIDNLDESRSLRQIKKSFRDIQFNAMIVCPIYYHHKIFGVVSIRMPNEESRISDSDIHFMDYMAKVTSLYMSTLDAQTIGKYGLVGVPSNR